MPDYCRKKVQPVNCPSLLASKTEKTASVEEWTNAAKFQANSDWSSDIDESRSILLMYFIMILVISREMLVA